MQPANDNIPDTLLWKAARAARELCISTKTLREHVRAGEIAFVPIGRGEKRPRLAFDPQDIRAFIERNRSRAACPSIDPKTARTTSSTSKSGELGFMALRAARTAATLKV
jgi:hypothetical protein